MRVMKDSEIIASTIGSVLVAIPFAIYGWRAITFPQDRVPILGLTWFTCLLLLPPLTYLARKSPSRFLRWTQTTLFFVDLLASPVIIVRTLMLMLPALRAPRAAELGCVVVLAPVMVMTLALLAMAFVVLVDQSKLRRKKANPF